MSAPAEEAAEAVGPAEKRPDLVDLLERCGSCRVLLQAEREPRLLPCLHSVCRQCLRTSPGPTADSGPGGQGEAWMGGGGGMGLKGAECSVVQCHGWRGGGQEVMWCLEGRWGAMVRGWKLWEGVWSCGGWEGGVEGRWGSRSVTGRSGRWDVQPRVRGQGALRGVVEGVRGP